MSDRTRFIGSMYGWHCGEFPSCTLECAAFEERTDKAHCAMCNAMHVNGVWPDHPDLAEVPGKQLAVIAAFLELVMHEFSSFTCPFPRGEKCPSLKRLSRPPARL